MTIELISYTNPDVLQNFGLEPNDIYQTLGYCSVDAEMQHAAPHVFYYAEGDIKAVIPVQIRPIIHALPDISLSDGISPYGYPGILYNKQPDTEQIAQLIHAVTACCVENKIVSLFIRMHPCFNQQAFENTDQLQQVVHGNTIYVDLQKSIEEIRQSYSTNHKRDLKSLHRSGYSYAIDDASHFNSFIEAYGQSMKRVDAASFYLFGAEYFNKLRIALGAQLILISAIDPDGHFAAGALFSVQGQIVEYLFGGTMDRFRKDAPSKLVFDAAIQEYCGKYKWLHLGGGLGSQEDELFRFKRGFSPAQWNFSTLRLKTIPLVYDQLSLAHLQATSSTPSNYFPLYRQ